MVKIVKKVRLGKVGQAGRIICHNVKLSGDVSRGTDHVRIPEEKTLCRKEVCCDVVV